MTTKQRADTAAIVQEVSERAPNGWPAAQHSIADAAGIALLLVEGHQPPALAIANNNSICEALQSSPDYVSLCDPYCGVAHSRTVAEDAVVHYRCHAGLECFAIPVQFGDEQPLAIIGGRAFARSEGGEVIFKAEIGAVTPQVCQVQGVWVRPRSRGQGLAAPGMAAVVVEAARSIAPLVSLYVNDFNAPARAAYRRVGFDEVGQLMSVMF